MSEAKSPLSLKRASMSLDLRMLLTAISQLVLHAHGELTLDPVTVQSHLLTLSSWLARHAAGTSSTPGFGGDRADA